MREFMSRKVIYQINYMRLQNPKVNNNNKYNYYNQEKYVYNKRESNNHEG
jgi:hypothetical protein